MVKCPGCGEDNPPKFRLCGYCGTPLAGPATSASLPAHEVRKTVTILFSDLKGSTALAEHLDPEAMREVTDRYFRAMAAEITRHGGKIEKYIGDAIMAVFGLPRAHEDDALRAVRAAAGMQTALQRVNGDLMQRYGVSLANRTGINTGEVVANDDQAVDQKLAIGDAVNVAARLEQAAPENEIYLGEITYRLVRDAVEVEAVEPLELKGKAQRVPAYRLLSAPGLDGNVRRKDTPVVGRDAELAALDELYREVVGRRAARLATIVGDAGVGKSRLVHETLERVAPRARVLRGRCLPYGEGVTFWPLRGMLTEAADIRADDPPELARAKVLQVVGDADVAERLASAVGLNPAQFPLLELYWAARKFLEGLATTMPVVALLDDIHWADPAFLDLIEHILDAGTGAPILLLATTRPDLIQERPQWGERDGAIRLVLGPLSNDASAQVVANLLGSAGLAQDVVDRIVEAAEGNPLFVEQMLSMLIDSGALRLADGRWRRAEDYGEIAVPPTIQALLEARIDRLQREERAAVDPASVIGLEFAQPAVEALAPAPVRVAIDTYLTALTTKQLIRRMAAPGQTDLRYRFDHHLVRETVYNGLLKRARATLHAEFVRWADRVNAEYDRGLEFEEILGYHLEQAYRYLSELGPLDEQGLALGRDGAKRLGSAARRAFLRGDMQSAEGLFRRAIAMLPKAHEERLAMLPELGDVLLELGNFTDARAFIEEAKSLAQATSNRRVAAAAQLVRMLVRLHSGEPGNWSEDTLLLTTETIPALEREAAHSELAKAWRLIALVEQIAGRLAQTGTAISKVITHARMAGDDRMVARGALGLSFAALYGPTPVPQAIEQCGELIATELADRQVQCLIMCKIAQLHAMQGDFETARSLYREARAGLRDLGHGVREASSSLDSALIELLAGDPVAAERELRGDYEALTAMGETYFLPTMAALLGRAVGEQGRDAEALTLTEAAEKLAAEDDVDSQVLWRCARVPILCRAGSFGAAEELARAALDIAKKTDVSMLQAAASIEIARVLSLTGRTADAQMLMREAISLYTAKGDIVSAGRAAIALSEMTSAVA